MNQADIDYCDLITKNERDYKIINFSISSSIEQANLYKLLCPPLIFACLMSVLLNSCLMIVGHFGTRNKSPVLLLSLNLATTDTIASFINGVTFVLNSYLPVVYNVKFTTCPILILEIARISAFISSVLHLLALAFIHYRGILRPLHYRSRAFYSNHITRSINLTSLICWIIPIMAFSIYFSSIPCQGFQSDTCDFLFLAAGQFRLFLLAFFLIPLTLMFIFYIKIFYFIKQNQKMRIKRFATEKQMIVHFNKKENFNQKLINSRKSLQHKNKNKNNSNNNNNNNSNTNNNNNHMNNIKKDVLNCNKNNNDIEIIEVDEGNNICYNNDKHKKISRLQISSQTKTLKSSLLILGTFLVCYIPPLIFLNITCFDKCPYNLFQLPKGLLTSISFVCNSLVIAKAIVDPFIYTFRVNEVRVALNKLFTCNSNVHNSIA